jgi:orotate phosphoribosyltransferase
VESWDAVRLAQPAWGHFDLGTGYHGDVWLELDALLLRPAWLRQPVRWMADRLREHAVDAVCGPVEGGAFLAYAVADLLTAAFLPGYRTPGETAGYHLLPVPGGIAASHSRPVLRGIAGWRVGIVDDAVNAGTAVAACAAAVRAHDALPVAVTSLLALGDASTLIPERLGVPFYPAATLPSQTWPVRQCPLCAEAIPLTPAPPPLKPHTPEAPPP